MSLKWALEDDEVSRIEVISQPARLIPAFSSFVCTTRVLSWLGTLCREVSTFICSYRGRSLEVLRAWNILGYGMRLLRFLKIVGERFWEGAAGSQLDLVFCVVKNMGEVEVRRNLCMGIGSILGDELSPKDWSNSKLFGDLEWWLLKYRSANRELKVFLTLQRRWYFPHIEYL